MLIMTDQWCAMYRLISSRSAHRERMSEEQGGGQLLNEFKQMWEEKRSGESDE